TKPRPRRAVLLGKRGGRRARACHGRERRLYRGTRVNAPLTGDRREVEPRQPWRPFGLRWRVPAIGSAYPIATALEARLGRHRRGRVGGRHVEQTELVVSYAS